MSEPGADVSKIIKLPFDRLRCFEAVEEQFAHLGVLFENAIVLQPSNLMYQPTVGSMVLMAAPENGWLEIRFTLPIAYFSCLLTSSQHATISAYGDENQLLQTIETEKNGDSDRDEQLSFPHPNLPIALHHSPIQKIVFNSLDGQLVIHDIRFGV